MYTHYYEHVAKLTPQPTIRLYKVRIQSTMTNIGKLNDVGASFDLKRKLPASSEPPRLASGRPRWDANTMDLATFFKTRTRKTTQTRDNQKIVNSHLMFFQDFLGLYLKFYQSLIFWMFGPATFSFLLH